AVEHHQSFENALHAGCSCCELRRMQVDRIESVEPTSVAHGPFFSSIILTDSKDGGGGRVLDAEIDLLHLRIGFELSRRALEDRAAGLEHVAVIGDVQRE